MSNVTWPDIFPAPTLQSYSIAPDEVIARTKMDSGPARQRRRFTSAPTMVGVRWIFTDDLFAMFEAWYKYKALAGAAWFTISLNNGIGSTGQQARFVEPYSATPLSDRSWEVATKLEVREMGLINEGTLDLLLAGSVDTAGLEQAANTIHQAIHSTIPNNW